MPPRAKRKLEEDSPYGSAGVKRSTLPSSTNGLYPREPRERDGYSNASALMGRERDHYDKYSGLSSYEREAVPVQSNKRRKVEAAGGAYYAATTMPRGEEGPLITLDLSTMPHSAILKYLQVYNLVPAIYPPAISVQRPTTPHSALLKSPSAAKQSTLNNLNAARATPGYGRFPQPYWEEQELQDPTAISTVKSKSTVTKTITSNGVAATSTTAMYTTTTSVLGLSAANLEVEVPLEHTAMYDAEEARNTLTGIAQSHWLSVSSVYKSAQGFGGTPVTGAGSNRLNEREVIEDFMVGLRAKELAVRMTT